MQNDNSTEKTAVLLRDLALASRDLALGFERAAELPEHEMPDAIRDVMAVIREIRGVALTACKQTGLIMVFMPDGDDAQLCDLCGKTLDAHLGEQGKCP